MIAVMDIRSLEVFLTVAKHLNYTRAGEAVNLSQPSVSVRIRQLEAELGVKLFEKIGKKVLLTDAGQLLVPYAGRVIAAVSEAQRAIDDLQGLERGTLRIGASTTPGMYLIPQTLARFKHEHPKIEIQLGIKDTRAVENGVMRDEFDFGFVGGHLVGHQVKTIPWITDQIVLVVARDHSLARKKVVRADDLKNERFIVREAGSATQATTFKHLAKIGLKIKSLIKMENPESVKKAVQSGSGIAFISKFAVEAELKARTLVAVRVRNLDIKRDLRIVCRKDKHLSRAAQMFIEMAK